MLLALLAFIWLIPIVWLLVTSFSSYKGINTMHFFPQRWSLDNYMQLFFRPDTVANFPAWFRNSLIIGAATCVISTLFVLMVAYAMSCMRFPARKPLMSIAIILGMFPGVLSMIAIYFVMKLLGLTDSMAGLIIIYSAGSGLGYLICKGFFDTIPVSLRESAKLEGASELSILVKIVIPLSKPIIVSAATTIMLIGFVNAGIMKLGQAIPVVFGANIGSTATAQILRLGDLAETNILLKLLKPSSFAPILIYLPRLGKR